MGRDAVWGEFHPRVRGGQCDVPPMVGRVRVV